MENTNNLNLTALRAEIAAFLLEEDYPQSASDVFLSVFDRLSLTEDKEFFDRIVRYRDGIKVDLRASVKAGSASEAVAKRLSVSTHTTDFLFFLCLVPYLRERYKRAGIDEQIFLCSMRDLKCKMIECHKMYGVYGSFVADWFAGFFDMTRVGLGRLQFEVRKINFPLLFVCGGKLFHKGQKYVNIHIPSLGPLPYEEVLYAYRMAYEYFKSKFNGEYVLFATNSWLLNPAHRKMLPEGSNILRFMDDYKVVFKYVEPGNFDFWRIFYREYDKNLTDLPTDTALQRGYRDYLASGKMMCGAIGVFLFDGKTIKK